MAAMIEHPGSTEVFELAGDIALSMQQGPQAIERYRVAVECSDTPALGLLDKLGRQWLAAGHPFRSVEILERMVRADPSNLPVRRDLAGLLASLALNDARPNICSTWCSTPQRASAN